MGIKCTILGRSRSTLIGQPILVTFAKILLEEKDFDVLKTYFTCGKKKLPAAPEKNVGETLFHDAALNNQIKDAVRPGRKQAFSFVMRNRKQ